MRVIIVGAGEVGFHSARRLMAEHKDVVVIDKNARVLQRIVDNMDVQTIEGSGCSPRVLEDAGVREADMLLAVTDSDEINLMACTFANILSPGITKVARIRSEDFLEYGQGLSEQIHIDTFINPELEVVRNIESLLGSTGVVDTSEFADGRIRLVGTWVGKDSPLAGRTLVDIRQASDRRFIVAALIREDDLIVPTGLDMVQEGDLLYFVCEDLDLDTLLKSFGVCRKAQKNLLIVGGGNIGLRLAMSLEKKGLHAKIMDRDEERCRFLAERLSRTVVLHGDGTNQEALLEENVRGMDVVVTLTDKDEVNVLSSLLCRKLGAGMAVTRINKSEYVPLVRTIGLQHIVSPRLSAVNTILKYARKGRVISTVSIKDEAEALEAIALKNSAVVGKPIFDLPFPKGSIVLGIMRGNAVVIPTGSDTIQADDRLIILSLRGNIAKVEKALAVKLEQF